MGYLHIVDTYKDQRILAFRECYALEKIHGTSARVRWRTDKGLGFFSGGESYERFVGLFDQEVLGEKFLELGRESVVVYGEAYGGKQQGMRDTYGPDLAFTAFDVRVGDLWLAVPDAERLVQSLGLEFVPYNYGPATWEWLDEQRDLPSRVAGLRGVEGDHPAEGVVVRPPFEVTLNNGSRVIAKHKRPEFRETKTARPRDPEKLKILEEADAIAEEWVTDMRLTHVLDKLPHDVGVEQTRDVILAMQADVEREAEGEIVVSREATRAIGKRTATLFRARLQERARATGGKG